MAFERKINKTNDDLVDRIISPKGYAEIVREQLPVTDEKVIAAMRRVDRRMFIPEEETCWPAERYYLFGADVPDDTSEVPSRACAYADVPVGIGNGLTCSQPSLVAYMIQLLGVEPGMKVLEIGSGCGYAAAILAEMGARVVGLERVFSLHFLGQRNAEAHFGPDWMKRTMLLWVNGVQGFPSEGPYDRILISAQPPAGFDTAPLAEQLREKTGAILFPDNALVHQRYDKGRLIEKKYAPQVCFVPLIERGKE